jgi:hypothetical protein
MRANKESFLSVDRVCRFMSREFCSRRLDEYIARKFLTDQVEFIVPVYNSQVFYLISLWLKGYIWLIRCCLHIHSYLMLGIFWLSCGTRYKCNVHC